MAMNGWQRKNESGLDGLLPMSDFPESQRQKIIDEIPIIDPKTQAIGHAEQFSFGFVPSGNDSTKTMQINVPDFVESVRLSPICQVKY